MISKQDILERAREWQLRPEVVEKDYVLGWLLAAIGTHEDVATTWVLKGGTCVKKCFFETYRFSEDLDFSLLPEAEYSQEAIKSTLQQLTDIAHDLSGIEFSIEALSVRQRMDKLGRATYEGKVGYKGPLAVPGWPRILFDITQHEPVLDEPVLRPILHPYPDGPLPADALVSTYSFEELVAEKTRALYERSRPRDLYDVVYILTNSAALIRLDHAREVFGEKCAAKQLSTPSAAELVRVVTAAPELISEWANMLAHQLPALPVAEAMIGRLGAVLTWLNAQNEVTVAASAPAGPLVLTHLPSSPVETVLAPAPSSVWGAPVALETVRFAGANRLLVEFIYSGKLRTLEPYSLRRSSKGNLLLYGWELQSSRIKCFDVAKMSGLRTTNRTFAPRFAVEFTGTGVFNVPAVPLTRARTFRRTSLRSSGGPVYVFRCPVCSKEFRHRRNDGALRTHRMSSGGPYCPSKRGYLERIL